MVNYKFKNRILFLIVLIPLFSFSQNFSLKGEFKGSETDRLVLKYIDIDDNYISDTLNIVNNEFQSSGTINGVQKVLIIGNMASQDMEDPNLGYFFLEPEDIKIQLEENRFKNLSVFGSPTQKEFETINKKTLLIFSEIDSIAETQSNDSRELIQSRLARIQALELNYAYKNPKSHLSPYFINFYERSIPIDSLIAFYKKLPEKNKNSVYGQNIKTLLKKNKVEAYAIAPNFKSTDMDGKSISLETFKGKYLLIDFWAGWCVPCVKNLPELKTVYKEFNDKGLEILGVSFDKSVEDWKRSVTKNDIEFWKQIYVGLDNIKTEGSISEKYDIQPIPAYILIDKEGVVIERYLGASSGSNTFSDLIAKLNQLFNE